MELNINNVKEVKHLSDEQMNELNRYISENGGDFKKGFRKFMALNLSAMKKNEGQLFVVFNGNPWGVDKNELRHIESEKFRGKISTVIGILKTDKEARLVSMSEFISDDEEPQDRLIEGGLYDVDYNFIGKDEYINLPKISVRTATPVSSEELSQFKLGGDIRLINKVDIPNLFSGNRKAFAMIRGFCSEGFVTSTGNEGGTIIDNAELPEFIRLYIDKSMPTAFNWTKGEEYIFVAMINAKSKTVLPDNTVTISDVDDDVNINVIAVLPVDLVE